RRGSSTPAAPSGGGRRGGLGPECSSREAYVVEKETPMKDCRQFYIDGKWVAPTKPNDFPVTNPATEQTIGTISLGSEADVDKAVAAARRAFATFSETTREERLDLLNRIIAAYQAKYDEMAETISQEMGAPLWLSKAAQAAAGMGHFFEMTKVLAAFPFEEQR